jgi:hypothetical protein
MGVIKEAIALRRLQSQGVSIRIRLSNTSIINTGWLTLQNAVDTYPCIGRSLERNKKDAAFCPQLLLGMVLRTEYDYTVL